MDTTDYIDTNSLSARIKVVGVGGGGCNALNRMIDKGLQGVDFVAVNTDAQALARSQADACVYIGDKVTRGLGAGGVPEMGRKAAEESASVLQSAIGNVDMVFVTAGMGGGTGTGAAPVVARVARTLGALTIGIVSMPFSFEGRRRMENACEGIASLREEVDTLIVIPNDRLLQVVDQRASLHQAFSVADEVLHQGIQAISELITVPGLINLDFADVRSIMQGGGAALMSVGYGKGEHRARMAAEQAIANPLLDVTIQGAQGILLNIMGSPDMTLYEVTEAANMIRDIAHPDANVIFGAVINPELKDELRISVVATGFQRLSDPTPPAPSQRAIPEPASPPERPERPVIYDRSPYPRYENDRYPRPGNDPLPRYGSDPVSRQGNDHFPRQEPGPLPRQGNDNFPRQEPGPLPLYRERPASANAMDAMRDLEGRAYPAPREQDGYIRENNPRDPRPRDNFAPRMINTDDLDVPTFLRNRARNSG
jgi:cell division protein FtsZ